MFLIKYFLPDGSTVSINEINVILYNKSNSLSNIEEKTIKIDSTNNEDYTKKVTMLLIFNDNIYFYKISDAVRIPGGSMNITLENGTIMEVSEKNIIIYSEPSKMMDQI